MTRKVTRNYSLSVVIPFIGILIALIAGAVLAQTTGAGQPTGKLHVAPLTTDVNAPLQALQRSMLQRGGNVERGPVRHLRTNRHGAHSMDSNPPMFLPAVTYYSGGSNPFSVAVADLNGDGKPDLVVANNDGGYVGVLLGNGDGTFQSALAYSSGGLQAHSVAVADVNGDGKPDVLVVNPNVCPSGCGNATVGVLLGNGDGTFQSAVTYDSGGSWSQFLATGDVNGDGRPDVVVANWQSGSVGVLLGEGDGTFQPVVTYSSGGLAYSVAVSDVNGDGKLDLVVANWISSAVGVLLGNGDGTFQPAVTYGSGTDWALAVAVADANGDGKPDLVVANSANYTGGSLSVLLGNGDGTFQPEVSYDSGGLGPQSVAIADVNGDGNPDLLEGNANNVTNEGSVGVLLGNGDGTFQAPLIFDSGGLAAFGIAVADVNGDGRPDLLVVNYNSWTVGVLLNNTGLHSPTATALASSWNPAGTRRVVTYTATVTTQDGGVASGTVTFQDGGATVASVRLNNNQAAYSTSYRKGGVHTITAKYSGDLNYLGSTSAPLTETVVQSHPSTTVLATSGSPSYVGQAVTFTATVTSSYGAIPDGELVTFYDGTTALGSVALASGTAAYTTSSLSAKTHTIKATYAGDLTFLPSTGNIKQLVLKYSTATALTSNPNPSNYGQPVTFTATVTPSGPYPLTAKVKFWDGTVGIGTATLSGGVAKLTKSTLAVGTHPITAQYLGDAANDKSTSPAVEQVVQ